MAFGGWGGFGLDSSSAFGSSANLAQPSLFGVSQTTFGQQPQQSSFGGVGGFGQQPQQPAFGGFGASAFGAPAQPPALSLNTNAWNVPAPLAIPAFGSGFGAQPQAPAAGGFGSFGGGFGFDQPAAPQFGADQNSFGAPPVRLSGSRHTKFRVTKERSQKGDITNYWHLCMMPEYMNASKSPEELRWEDMCGEQPQNNFGFGAAAQPAAAGFGSFGFGDTTNSFGSFGQPQQPQQQVNQWGQPVQAAPAFDFGFGQQQQQPANAFSFGDFGAGQQQNQFNFGGATNPATNPFAAGGAFSLDSNTNAWGAPQQTNAFSFGNFGAPAANNNAFNFNFSAPAAGNKANSTDWWNTTGASNNSWLTGTSFAPVVEQVLTASVDSDPYGLKMFPPKAAESKDAKTVADAKAAADAKAGVAAWVPTDPTLPSLDAPVPVVNLNGTTTPATPPPNGTTTAVATVPRSVKIASRFPTRKPVSASQQLSLLSSPGANSANSTALVLASPPLSASNGAIVLASPARTPLRMSVGGATSLPLRNGGGGGGFSLSALTTASHGRAPSALLSSTASPSASTSLLVASPPTSPSVYRRADGDEGPIASSLWSPPRALAPANANSSPLKANGGGLRIQSSYYSSFSSPVSGIGAPTTTTIKASHPLAAIANKQKTQLHRSAALTFGGTAGGALPEPEVLEIVRST